MFRCLLYSSCPIAMLILMCHVCLSCSSQWLDFNMRTCCFSVFGNCISLYTLCVYMCVFVGCAVCVCQCFLFIFPSVAFYIGLHTVCRFFVYARIISYTCSICVLVWHVSTVVWSVAHVCTCVACKYFSVECCTCVYLCRHVSMSVRIIRPTSPQ